jgi:hypothetical protein
MSIVVDPSLREAGHWQGWLLVAVCVAFLAGLGGFRGLFWMLVRIVCTAVLIALAFDPERLNLVANPAARRACLLLLCALLVSAWGSLSFRVRGEHVREDHTDAQWALKRITNVSAWALSAIAMLIFVGIGR